MRKVEKVTFRDFEEELIKYSQAVRNRHVSSTLQQDYFDIQNSEQELGNIKNSCKGVDYVYRKGSWYIRFIGLSKEVGVFSSKPKAEKWAETFLEVELK